MRHGRHRPDSLDQVAVPSPSHHPPNEDSVRIFEPTHGIDAQYHMPHCVIKVCFSRSISGKSSKRR